jgi:hypothetical protein
MPKNEPSIVSLIVRIAKAAQADKDFCAAAIALWKTLSLKLLHDADERRAFDDSWLKNSRHPVRREQKKVSA